MKKLLVVLGSMLLVGAGTAEPLGTGQRSLPKMAISASSASTFVRFADLEGGADVAGREGWSEVISLVHRVLAPEGGSGATRSRAPGVMEPITLVKPLDASSPKLAEAADRARTFSAVEIELTRPAGAARRATYYSLELENVRVATYELRSPESDDVGRPVETISLVFERLTATYFELDAEGRPRGRVQFTWSAGGGRS